MNYNVEILKHPTEEDWLLCKQLTLNTIGKTSTKMPNDEWKVKLLKSEHSPIRCLTWAIKMQVPYFVSVHFCRHKFGVEHFVQSQRNDRQDVYDRTQAPQGELVSHVMYINAQELMFMARRRLCKQASQETQDVMKQIVAEVIKLNPEMKEVLVPNCVYRNGLCTEFFPCNKSDKNE